MRMPPWEADKRSSGTGLYKSADFKNLYPNLPHSGSGQSGADKEPPYRRKEHERQGVE